MCNVRYGWVCPKCNSSVSPDEKTCPMCMTNYYPLYREPIVYYWPWATQPPIVSYTCNTTDNGEINCKDESDVK